MLALYIVGGIVALILIVAAIVGMGWQYEKSISINAPLQKVWDSHVKEVGAGSQTIVAVADKSELSTQVDFIGI
jgi:hypothetical protein